MAGYLESFSVEYILQDALNKTNQLLTRHLEYNVMVRCMDLIVLLL